MTDVVAPPREAGDEVYEEEYADDTHDEGNDHDASHVQHDEHPQNIINPDDGVNETDHAQHEAPAAKDAPEDRDVQHDNSEEVPRNDHQQSSENNELQNPSSENAAAPTTDTHNEPDNASHSNEPPANETHNDVAPSQELASDHTTEQQPQPPVSQKAKKVDSSSSEAVHSPRAGKQSSPSRGGGGPRMTAAAEKDTEINLLYVPPNVRSAIVDEHERHRERMDAITLGRSISQSTAMSRVTQGSVTSRKSSPRNKVDPLTQQIMENHKKALDRVMQPGPQRLPLVHITHYKRLGNTHGHRQEFVNPSAPHEPLASRERRLQNNNYRSGRLNAAERVDDENAKFVSALINVKSVVPSTMCLLEQERERQAWMRQIERGPAKSSPRGTPSASIILAESSARESHWDNRISNVIPRPPVISSATMEHSARPKVIWDDKLTQAREIERRKLASLQQQNDEATSAASPEEHDATSPVAAKGKKTQGTKSRRPKPPPSSLIDCMEKVPPVNSGRHSGHSSPQRSQENSKKTDENSAAAPEVTPEETTKKPQEEQYSDDEEMVPQDEDEEEGTTTADNAAPGSSGGAAEEEAATSEEAPAHQGETTEVSSDEKPVEPSQLLEAES
ncbi:Hypothetical protein, putative [Bodo saltans]|uniref:Uncharacterized protein n=1 Tax=Bodo saltans TaxID=75058 RepID=A0A0S4J9M3_BODSA|nr:Hypothetical protein, putative [Bodo saltans]|eukprot:CUG86830.1 Hypothetical protein, putative [Bodo saltans]